MARRNPLLENLYDLRDTLRSKLLDEGEAKVICTDEAIQQMAKMKPSRLSDFLAISGLDSDFLERFAHHFLNVLYDYTAQDVKKVKFSMHASHVLDRYKDRLTDISKTNPNIYTGRIEKTRNFDLFDESKTNDLIDFISLKKKFLSFDDTDELDFNHMTSLYRQINKDYKDQGTYHLYLAYPYVEALDKKEDFPIKAPLAYMPVVLERKQKKYQLSFNKEKDIVINRDLILTLLKLDPSLKETKAPDLEDLSYKSLKEILIPYYNTYGLNLKCPKKQEFMAFKSLLKDQFIKSKPKGFNLKPYITFGRYQLFSSMIQKDMGQIIESNTYNELLEGLIDEEHLYDQEQSLDLQTSNEDVNESGLVYINDINFSQEKVLDLIDKEKKIVIWGPPGTGKSQTITSLIAHQVLRNENVLLVSEKKVALDVIYHRLGQASKHTMFIDDASDKNAFYTQLSGFIEQGPPSRLHNNDIYRLEEEIKVLDKTFNQALNLLYKKNKQYKPLSDFYNRYLQDKDILENLTPKKVYKVINQALDQVDFKDIENLENTFDKDQKLNDYLNHHYVISSYPWFQKLETKISRSSIIEFETFMNDLSRYLEAQKHAWFLKKRKLKKKFYLRHQNNLQYLSAKKSIHKKLLKALMEDSYLRNYLQANIKKLNKMKVNYDKLSAYEIDFLNLIIHDHDLQVLHKNPKLRTYIFDAYMTGFLENFKAMNQKYLYILNDYEKHMDKLKAFMDEKRHVARESFEMKLFSHALDFANTKRIMDIKRILESQKKPSIKAFFDMFHSELFSNVKVWLLTPEVVSSILPLDFNLFDLVIFDEASQMYVEKGIPSIYRAKKVVIAGDPKQLRPSSLGMGRVLEEDPFEEDEILKNVTYDAKSLLDLARYRYKEALLNYHYRSQYQELIEFSNHAFYQGKLIISPNVKTPDHPPISYLYVKKGQFIKKHNLEEAKAVINLLKKVLKDKSPEESIGIITFNSTQRDCILNLMDEVLFKKSIHQKRLEKEVFRKVPEGDQSLFVKNIENVQGDERDIIIFSMAYGQDESGVIKRRFGWLNHEGGQNRLNVAITRARKKIYFVSSIYPEALKVDDLSGQGPKLLKDFMRYCFYISNQKQDMAQEVLLSLYKKESMTQKHTHSLMKEDIKHRLMKSGYLVNENIGIGQFKIDLAIYDEEIKAYKLAIICDLNDDRTFTARKELLHQERFLMARGWKVYRVFHMNWYEDAHKVLREIKSKLK
ncbi:MAG: AAA domain-containing protein [Candidatus Izemoplasmatales bacterium]